MTNTKKQPSFLRQAGEFIVLLIGIFLIRTFIFTLYQVPTGSMETTMLVGDRFFADKISYFIREPRKGEIVALIQPDYQFSKNPVMQLFERYVWGPQNWTKRIIATPGQYIKGVIEDGKPVIYVDGKKLDEPYLNPYPLITLKTGDPKCRYVQRPFVPGISFEEQPFYHMKESQMETLNGMPLLEYPTNARPSSEPLAKRGDRFWDKECGADEFSVQLGPDEYWLMGDNRRGSRDSRFFGPIKKKDIFARIIWRLFSVEDPYLAPSINSTLPFDINSIVLIDMIKHPIDFWKRIRWNRTFQPVY